MTAASNLQTSEFRACPAEGVRAEFGVCRGEPICHIHDLILGDTFRPKRHATWTRVRPDAPNPDGFTIDRAANLPQQKLHVIAELIFMTTTGRRLDVFATVLEGQLFFVSETEFQTGVEYVLIDIEQRNNVFVPAIVPTAAPTQAPAAEAHSVDSRLRLIG
ncbi:hypothetical protein [Marivita sp.]|uniref:hypothetical protein n=1 Tax=Marivita sp. TaxID=2003365 RepID=UPI003F6B5EE7